MQLGGKVMMLSVQLLMITKTFMVMMVAVMVRRIRNHFGHGLSEDTIQERTLGVHVSISSTLTVRGDNDERYQDVNMMAKLVEERCC